MYSQKIVIPGGAGLVGQNLVLQLKNSGFKDIIVIDKHEANLHILRKLHPDIGVQCADLAKSGDWEKHFESADTVILLQAQIGGIHREDFIRNNLEATRLIIAAIKKYKIAYVVHVSSSVVNTNAQDYYSITKKQQEIQILESHVNCIVLRPSLMFGWFDRKHLGWLSRFMHKIPIFPIPGKGQYIRQPLFVVDFCNIVVSCIKSHISGEIVNITGLEKISYIDIIRTIKSVTAADCWIVPIPYRVFFYLLKTWSLFDKNPPFTTDQLTALVACDEFEVVDWPTIFNVQATSFQTAINQTFTHSEYSQVYLEF